jgi:hypothetical protein
MFARSGWNLMRRAAALVVALGLADATARGQDPFGAPPGYSQSQTHQPWSERYTGMTPNSPTRNVTTSRVPTATIYQPSNRIGYLPWGSYTPYNGRVFGPYYNAYGVPYYALAPRYVAPGTPPYVLPPIVLPPVGPGNFSVPATNERAAAPRATVRPAVTDPDRRQRAQNEFNVGLAEFAARRYDAAEKKFRRAAELSADYGDARLAQSLSLVALGRLQPAARAAWLALKVDPALSQSTMHLDRLYGPEQRAERLAHRERLATLVAESPDDADAWLLLGLHLYFDGDRPRAARYLAESARLSPYHQPVLEPFFVNTSGTPGDDW